MKLIKWAFLSLAMFSVFTACRDESSTVGDGWLSSELRSAYTDTCTVKLSTILADSVNTSNISSIQVGHYKDSYYGDLTAKGYVEYGYGYFTANEDVKYSLDSMTIKVKWKGDFMGDTLQVLPIRMYELRKNIELHDDGYLYTTSSTPYGTLLGSFNAYVYPSQTKAQYEYRLPDSIGQRFLNKILDSQGLETMRKQSVFREYFRGVAFVPGVTNIITNIDKNDSSLVMTMYYHGDNSTTQQSVIFSPTTPSYSSVTQDKTGTPLALFDKKPDESTVVSSETNNISYIQSSTGLYTKIEFPFLSNLCLQGEMASITAAVLYLYPVRGTYNADSNPLPKSLAVYTANATNVTGSQLSNSMGTATQTGNLTSDQNDPDTQYYTFDLTSFLQTNLTAIGNNVQHLQLTFPSSSINTSCKGVLFGNQLYDNGENYKSKLVVRYTVYNSNN